jgi:hypothetical protein
MLSELPSQNDLSSPASKVKGEGACTITLIVSGQFWLMKGKGADVTIKLTVSPTCNKLLVDTKCMPDPK